MRTLYVHSKCVQHTRRTGEPRAHSGSNFLSTHTTQINTHIHLRCIYRDFRNSYTAYVCLCVHNYRTTIRGAYIERTIQGGSSSWWWHAARSQHRNPVCVRVRACVRRDLTDDDESRMHLTSLLYTNIYTHINVCVRVCCTNILRVKHSRAHSCAHVHTYCAKSKRFARNNY